MLTDDEVDKLIRMLERVNEALNLIIISLNDKKQREKVDITKTPKYKRTII